MRSLPRYLKAAGKHGSVEVGVVDKDDLAVANLTPVSSHMPMPYAECAT